jgi:phytoene synthase
MEAVYAFCRVMDDIVDDEETVDSEQRTEDRKQEELNRWRRELDACEAGFPTHPIAVAIAEIRQLYGIPMNLFRKLITGVEMDLGSRRYGTFEELKVYCEHVASVVGLISVRVFGCRHPDADRYAADLGVALQMTNILRDLKPDAAAGRIYLPTEDLRRFGCSEREISTGGPSEALKRVMEFQAGRAWEHFGKAQQALRSSGEKRKLLPARIMGGVYARLLRRIQESGYDVFSRRVRVSTPAQLWVAAQCLVTSSS